VSWGPVKELGGLLGATEHPPALIGGGDGDLAALEAALARREAEFFEAGSAAGSCRGLRGSGEGELGFGAIFRCCEVCCEVCWWQDFWGCRV
jgi:hypothetical protein